MRFDLPKNLYSTYFHTGWFMRLFVPYRWMVFPFRELNELVPKKGKVVDLGCGHGIFANFLALKCPEREVFGVDINRRRIDFASLTMHTTRSMGGQISFRMEDILESKIDDADCFTLIDFLHHLPSVDAQRTILSKCANLLRPGSKLIIADIDMSMTVKYYIGKLVEFFVYPDMKTTYRPIQEIVKEIEENGFLVKMTKVDRGFPYASVLLECTKLNKAE